MPSGIGALKKRFPGTYVTKDLLMAMGVNLDAPLHHCEHLGVRLTSGACRIYRESGHCPGCDRWRCGCDD